MKDFKLVSFDLDYTLLNSDHLLDDKHLEWLKKISDDHILVFASGRPLEAMKPFAKQIGEGIVDYFISNNGSECVTAAGEHFFEAFLAEDLIIRVVETAFEHGVHPHFYHGASIVGFYDSPFIRRDERVTKLPVVIERNVHQAVSGKAIHKLIVMGEPVKMHGFYQAILPEPAINPILSKPYFMEIPSAGVHKGYALAILTERLGWGMDQVLACGDSYNDLEMLREAGLGLAVANAMPGVKAVADRVLTISCDDNLAELVFGLLDPDQRRPLLERYSHEYEEL